MIKSMTGFGRAEMQDGDRKFAVELKSVNHRYFDLSIRMPKKLNAFESDVRSWLKDYIQRGKVDVFVTYDDLSKGSSGLTFNANLAEEYLNYYKMMAEQFSIPNDMTVSKLGNCHDVFLLEDQAADDDTVRDLFERTVRAACLQFTASREEEGQHLSQDLLGKLDAMAENVEKIQVLYPDIMAAYRQKLENKVKELLGDVQIDENRLATELVLYADKIATDEETVRLKSHIKTMKQVLTDGNGIGRKLDFIAQEMNREANTILSKANDLNVANIAIDLKTEIEKVREQIQNIE